MRSAAGDEPGSGGTTALPIGEESSGRLTRSRARLLAGEKTEPTEAAQSVGDSRGKRRRVEGVSVGKNRAVEAGKRMLTAEEVALAARPLPPEEPPYPKSGDHADVVAWINAKDALYNKDNLGEEGSLFNILVLGRGKVRVNKSVASAASMESMDGRDMIADVARSVVNVSATEPDGKVLYTTGIIIEYDEIGKCAKILSSSSFMCTKEGKLRHPDQKVLVHLSKDTVVEARVLFFNGHYGISLLDISALFTLVPASLGSGPCYGQNVSVLDREVDHALVVSCGSILCLEYPTFERNHYVFTSYLSHLICTGGPVINNSGEVIGLVVKHIPQAAIVSTSIVRKCIQMWNQFGRIAHPIHHLKLTTVRMLDMVYRDELWSRHSIRSGFIVAEVCPNSIAEKIGIRRGDVIELIDLDHLSTVVELEEFLLSLAWGFLEEKLDSSSMIDIKIRVHDIHAKTSVCTILPMGFSDAAVRSYY
ncbi:hypothetical protein QYE76_012163 [Lolium multiflorum]|uniref:PDZ domain-containing protein n=1 Tax=Lolium multiflorum TaxID=4521 RepID=A0AAD8TWQ3_LOLMU|nr:hypothetical protein QYE76_012163 [Lolium multiflorum]